ncbi:CBS domain-containing protein CBSX6-like [Tasmannia lanceolata]|uniref:CBS domain-containing protein CBSX6-like n=1 Tax=Tasmannia lanceolata TaxID=3420 RepID=UPI00406408CE
MASVFIYHVIGDLTVGKPEMFEFFETETVESAIRAIGECTEGGIPVWKRKQHKGLIENGDLRQQRFVGIVNSLDIVTFLAREGFLEDQEKVLKTPISEVVMPNYSLLKLVDPGMRLIDALELMKNGVRRLLVPKSVAWKGMSKRFSVLYNGKWLKNLDSSGNATTSRLTSSNNKFCCLSREDVIRFIIGCLGALAPLPLCPISSLGAINSNYFYVDASAPALEATRKLPQDPCAVAVIETNTDGQHKIIGEISATKLWKCDYLAAAWALANLSAGQFVMGVEDHTSPTSFPDFSTNSPTHDSASSGSRLRKFSSRSIGFFSNQASSAISHGRSMYRGRSAPLTCKATSSLAALMAQMLSHRATHVWVTEAESEDTLVGVVSYTDILSAVIKHPSTVVPNP